MGQLDGLLKVRHAAALRAGLKHAAGSLDRVGQLLAERDRQPAWLLAVDVFAGLRGGHRGGGVPAVAGGDDHGVDVLAGQQFAEVAEQPAILVAVVLIDERLAGLAAAGLHVGDRHALDIGQAEHRAQVVRAARTDPDHSERDLLARGDCTVAAQRVGGNNPGERHRRGRRSGPLEKLAAGGGMQLRNSAAAGHARFLCGEESRVGQMRSAV